MPDTVLLVADSDEAANAFSGLIRDASSRARDHETLEPIDFRAALHRLESGPSIAACVVLTEQAGSPRDVIRLCDALAERAIPAIEIAAGTSVIGSSPGWIVRQTSDHLETVAAALDTLLLRQQHIRAIDAELELLRRGQEGVAGEIDRLSEEMRLASWVQRGMVPDDGPSVDWYEAAVLFRPATFCSGDIYDIRALDEHTACFFVADAVGHGVPAALLTMVISRALKMEWRDGEERDLGVAVSRLNRELHRISANSGRFATAVVGTIDRRNQEVCLVNAGHPSPILRAGDDVEEILPTGPLLGVFDGAEFEVERRSFPPGASLVVYSDGFETALSDARGADNRRIPSGEHVTAMRDLLSGDRACGAAIETLEQTLDASSGSLTPDDDLTAIAIRRLV